jgi:hypothetical protein
MISYLPAMQRIRLQAAVWWCAGLFLVAAPSVAAALTWAGYEWRVTTGGLAGNNTGSAANVVVDTNGYLHMKITRTGDRWYCAELFTTQSIGFGTYRWQIDGPVDKMDKNIVLGLFPYGPAAGIGSSGTNEIDIEYARWGNSAWPCGNYTVYPNSGSTKGSTTFNFTLSGTYTTSTFVWNSTSVAYTTQEGLRPAGDNGGLIKSWTYAPSNPGVNIPQRAMPLGMNLWLCAGCGGAPSDGQPEEIIIRSFQYIPLGTGVNTVAEGNTKKRPVDVSAHKQGIKIRLDLPVKQDLAVQIMNMQGEVVRTARLPAGEKELFLRGLGRGVHVAKISQFGITSKAVVLR